MSHHDYTAPHQNLPPRVAGENPEQQVFTVATGAAASSDIWTGYATDAGGLKTPQGKCWLELEATGAAAYVRFGTAVTTATTATNGAILPVGSPRRFFVDPTKDLYMDLFCATTGTVKWRRVGPIVERSRT